MANSGELIMWDKLLRALTLVATTDTIPDKETRCLSVPQVHHHLKSCVRRAVTRIDAIVAQQITGDDTYAELDRLIKEAGLEVKVTRFTGGSFNHGKIATPKGFILYG